MGDPDSLGSSISHSSVQINWGPRVEWFPLSSGKPQTEPFSRVTLNQSLLHPKLTLQPNTTSPCHQARFPNVDHVDTGDGKMLWSGWWLVVGPWKQCMHKLQGSITIPKASTVFWQPSESSLRGSTSFIYTQGEALPHGSIHTTMCAWIPKNPL